MPVPLMPVPPIDEFWDVDPFGISGERRLELQGRAFGALVEHHCQRSKGYARIVEQLFEGRTAGAVEELPYLAVPLFKALDLASVAPEEIVRTVTSSGTSGRAVSQVPLDRETALRQARALARITSSVVGKKRVPMVVVDHPGILSRGRRFDARAAAVAGFAPLSRSVHYLLDQETGEPDWAGLETYLSRFAGERVLVFGMTSRVWRYLYEFARRDRVSIDLRGSVLLHGGGWKKMESTRVDPVTYRDALWSQFGIETVCNYYGMAEQTGSIFLECREGRLHASAFSDVVVRHPETLEPLGVGHEGILQVLSVLPVSYPGHSLLTEDRATLRADDDCPCGWSGRAFEVHGRLPAAELKGCSDVGRAA